MAEIPKFAPSEIELGWPRNLFIFSLILLLVSGAAALALNAYQRTLVSQNAAIDKEIRDLAGTLPPAEIQKLLALDTQIKGLKQILPKHVYFSKILDLLELNTLPSVRLGIVSINQSNRQISIQGTAPSQQTISAQAAAYAAMTGIDTFAIKSVGVDVRGQAFTFSLTFKPDLILP